MWGINTLSQRYQTNNNKLSFDNAKNNTINNSSYNNYNNINEYQLNHNLLIGLCKPLSKTVRFNVLHVQPNVIFGSVKKQFMLF